MISYALMIKGYLEQAIGINVDNYTAYPGIGKYLIPRSGLSIVEHKTPKTPPPFPSSGIPAMAYRHPR